MQDLLVLELVILTLALYVWLRPERDRTWNSGG